MLVHAAFLRLAHQIVKSIERRAQLPIGDHATQARHRHQQQHRQNRDRDNDFDQVKSPGRLHPRSYAGCEKSQDSDPPRRGIAKLLPTWTIGSDRSLDREPPPKSAESCRCETDWDTAPYSLAL